MLAGILSILGCEGLFDPQDFESEEVAIFRADNFKEAPTPTTPAQLQIMTWNLKYGAGRIPFWFDCWGDRIQMTKEEVETNMAGIYDLITEVDPDILMSEEIELNSRRSAYYNMVQGVLNNTDLNYAAYFESWDSRYIPSEGLGRINLGTVIFSKYPISFAERIKQADRTDQDALTKPFYIKRSIGRAEIALDETRNIVALVVHTEAYDEDGTKKKHIEQFYEVGSAQTLPTVLGGDLNELPPTAIELEGFPDERSTALCGDDFDQPPYTPALLQPFYDTMESAISLERYGTTPESQQRYFTHTVLGPDDKNEDGEAGFWNRTLDYLFVTEGSWVEGSTDVLQFAGQTVGGDQGLGPVIKSNPMRLSDHAPVVGIWEVGQ